MQLNSILLSALVALGCGEATYAVEDSLEESFDGVGEFLDMNGRLDGLDLPLWSAFFDGVVELDAGFPISFETGVDAISDSAFLEIQELPWTGGFVQRLEVRDLNMFVQDDRPMGSTYLSMTHRLQGRRIQIGVARGSGSPTVLVATAGDLHRGLDVNVGQNIAIEFAYHEDSSLVEWRYDNDIDDELPTIEVGINEFEPIEELHRDITIESGARDLATFNAQIDNFRISPLRKGDFNYDQSFDKYDLAILANDLGSDDFRRDLNKDSIVDGTDRDIWVHEIANTYYGDANLDGEFNSADLVSIFNFAQYEDDIPGNSTWETGDWNLDGDFTTADLVLAFQDGGYEKGPVAAVPEPAFSLLPLLLLLWRRGNR